MKILQLPIKELCGTIVLYCASANSQRWRGNSYIRDGGILPYQRCHATDFYPGPSHRFQSFTHEGRGYRAVVTSATVWGQSAEDGEPIEVVEAEIMTFYTEEGKVCLLPPDAKGLHCSIAIIQPTVHCRVLSLGEWRRGKLISLHTTTSW